jgi:hypothetical protein
MKRTLLGLVLALTLALALPGCATRLSASANRAEQPLKPNPADVCTIANIVRASFETLSGPARQPWPWDRDRTLYMPQAIFVSNFVEHGQVKTLIETPEDYRRRFIAGRYVTEIGRHIERYGNVAQVRSVTIGRDTPSGPVQSRWVNYFQLYWDETRWWIAAVAWDQERQGLPIPESWIGKLDEDKP